MLHKFLDSFVRRSLQSPRVPAPPVSALAPCELVFRAELLNREVRGFECWAVVNLRSGKIIRLFGRGERAERAAKQTAAIANNNHQIRKLWGNRHVAA